MRCFCLFAGLFIVLCVKGTWGDPPTTAPPTTVPPTTVPPTTVPPTTAPPTTAPPTTVPPTTVPPTTVPPTTATPTTATPTTATPTTAPPTTAPPTTAPPTAPPTTVAPTIPPPPVPSTPDVGKWSVQDKTTNETCIIVSMATQVTVWYTRTDKKEVNVTLDIPKNATATGTCTGSQQRISITSEEKPDITMTITFSEDKKKKDYFLSRITFQIKPDEDHFPGKKSNGTINIGNSTLNLFQTGEDFSYFCKQETLNLKQDSSKHLAQLKLSKVQLEAFHKKKNEDFSTAVECKADSTTSDIVPIAVGCALALLVVIVLVAYLIGRRRSRASGYQSV